MLNGDSLLIQCAAGGTHGADQIGLALGIEGFAQTPDVDVDGARFDIDISAPYRIEKLLATEDTARALQEVAK